MSWSEYHKVPKNKNIGEAFVDVIKPQGVNIPNYVPPEIALNVNRSSLYNTKFTKSDIVALINKVISFNTRLYNKYHNETVESSPLYMELFNEISVMRKYIVNGKEIYGIRILDPVSNVYYVKECSRRGCIKLDDIDSDKIRFVYHRLYHTDVLCIEYMGSTLIGAFIEDYTLQNSLTSKEIAFVDMLYDKYDEMYNNNMLQNVNLNKYMNVHPSKKNKTNKLRFSETVNIKLIPSRKNNVVRGGKRKSKRTCRNKK